MMKLINDGNSDDGDGNGNDGDGVTCGLLTIDRTPAW
jgi:hypothetical protein